MNIIPFKFISKGWGGPLERDQFKFSADFASVCNCVKY